METKLRVGAVSYLNTKPLVWGFEQGLMKDEISLSYAYPSELARQLQSKELDIALLPVAEIENIPEATIISNYCIGASGPVASVCLFSNVPINDIKEVFLDYQSRSSVALLKILLQNYWKVKPVLVPSKPGYESEINHTTAALIIGDRAFESLGKYAYTYDLAEAWISYTGYPFVFAAWVTATKLGISFIGKFNEATGEGLKHIDRIVEIHNMSHYDLNKYYRENIDYVFDDKKREGLELFLSMIH